jgi:hypothetical protein
MADIGSPIRIIEAPEPVHAPVPLPAPPVDVPA